METQLPIELRHAYRAILRATTYLPDSAARAYIHKYAVTRFRSASDKINFRTRKGKLTKSVVERYSGQQSLREAQQFARQLQRAGQSSFDDLKKALLLTYGRIGKRRRELITELLLPEETSIPEDDKALERLISEPVAEAASKVDLHSKSSCLLRSQSTDASADIARLRFRQLSLGMPKENIWGRPMPLKRTANAKKKHWANLMTKILPPVPIHEWNRLRDLAIGALPIEDPPPRRAKAVSREQLEGDRSDMRLFEYFTTPVRVQNLTNHDITIDAEKGATCWTDPLAIEEVDKRKKFTPSPRSMRRLYASIWMMTPTMSKDPVTNIWITKWGRARSAFFSGQITAPSEQDEQFFEGAEKIKARSNKKDNKLRKRVDEPIYTLLATEDAYPQGVRPTLIENM